MTDRVVKLNPYAPGGEGLETWDPIPPEGLISGAPVQRGVMVHDSNGLQVGTWDCTAMTTKMEPYSVHEFMLLLEGDVTIVDEAGNEETIYAGQPFFLPKGFTCSWRQPGYIRKFFLILDQADGAAESDPAKLAVARPEPYGPPEGLREIALNAADFSTPKPVQRQHLVYESADGKIQAGTWDATAYERPITPSKRSEIMCILEGSVTMTSPHGEQTFHAGDSFFLPLGAPNGWRSEGYVRKFFCAIWP